MEGGIGEERRVLLISVENPLNEGCIRGRGYEKALRGSEGSDAVKLQINAQHRLA